MNDGIPGRLRKRCDTLGMSFRAVSQAAGLKDGVVVDIVSGKSKEPSAERLLRISKVLKCRLEWLLTGEGPVTSESPALTPQQQALLGLFDGMPPEAQARFLKVGDALAQPIELPDGPRSRQAG